MLVPAQTFCSCLNCNGKKQALEPEERTWNGIGCCQIKTATPCPSPISEIWGDSSLQQERHCEYSLFQHVGHPASVEAATHVSERDPVH